MEIFFFNFKAIGAKIERCHDNIVWFNNGLVPKDDFSHGEGGEKLSPLSRMRAAIFQF